MYGVRRLAIVVQRYWLLMGKCIVRKLEKHTAFFSGGYMAGCSCIVYQGHRVLGAGEKGVRRQEQGIICTLFK